MNFETISTTTKSPAQIVAELRELGLSDVRDFLSHIYTNYTASKQWSEASELWRESCTVYYLELLRALELMERAEQT